LKVLQTTKKFTWQDYKAIPNLYVHNKIVSKFTKQKLVELEEEMNKYHIGGKAQETSYNSG
jgi:hypothetical protein